MNLLTFTQNNISARFLAGITIVSMLLSALPAAFFVADAANTDAVGQVAAFVAASPASGNTEYVKIKFTGTGTLNLDGWTIDDNTGLRHTIASGVSLVTGEDYTVCGDISTPAVCDTVIDNGGNSVWNNTGDTMTLKDETSAVVHTVTWAGTTEGEIQGVGESSSVNFAPVACAPQFDAAGVTNIKNANSGDYFNSINDALADCDTEDGDEIDLLGNITTSALSNLDRPIVLDGNGFTIDAAFAKTSNSNNAAIGIVGDNVTVKNITLDGANGTQLHGINTYEAVGITVQSVTAKNFRSGMVVNGSTVDASDFTTSGNTWHGINVAPGSGVTTPSILNISNTSAHAEGAPVPHIFTDDVTAGVIEVNDLDAQYDVTALGNARVYFLKVAPIVKGAEYVVITGDTAAAENLPGWMFNRDVANATPIEFNEDESVIGDGALYVKPLSNTDGARKFIGEYFWQGAVADLDGFSYDFKIGAGGANTDSEEFYLNVYANFGESSPTKYYDCKYDVVPSNGTTGSFATVTFDPTQSYPVTTRGGGSASPYVCPAVPADMNTLGAGGATIRAFAINTGDTTLTDADLDGYFDNVILNTKTKVTTFDFEKGAVDPNDENQLTITAIKFHNRNADNNRDTGEEALDGWEMRLYKEVTPTDWTLVATGTTVSGQKKFPQQKDAGVYHICEVSQLGWTQVAPAEDTQAVNVSPNVAEEEPYCTSTTYSDESDRSTKPEIGNLSNDLNDQNQLNISGENYLDIAVDDCDNRTECLFSKTTTKLSGWEMRLYKEVAGIWTEIATSSTDNDGIYRFPTQYSAGVYHTCEVLEAGYAQGIGNWNGSGYLVNTANLSGAADEGPYCNTLTYTDIADRSSKSHFGNAVVVPTDTTNPTVTIKDESITCEVGDGYETISFKLKDLDSKIDKVVLNGVEKNLTDAPYSDLNAVVPGKFGAVEGINTLEVYDVAGNVTTVIFILCADPSTAPIATIKTGDEFIKTCDDGYRKLSYKLYDADGQIDRVEINGVVKDLTDNKYSDVNFLAPGVFGAVAGENTMVVFDTQGNNSTYTFFLCDALVMCEITSGPNTLVVENNEFAVPAYVHNNWTDNILGATWVWPTEYVMNPTRVETYTFEESFTVTDVDNATIEVAADNGYMVIVNGTVVIDRTAIGNNFADHTVLPPIDIASQLVSGENTVQVEVTNNAVAGSNSRSNPAGALFKIIVNAENACTVTTAPEDETIAPATLVITNPATPGMTLSSIYDFTAEYNDDDATEDLIQWAVRAGTCAASTGTMAGNVDGFSNSSTFAAPQFLATVDMSGWLNGEYCFVVNPLEQAGETNLRATQTFVLDNPVDEIDPETPTDTGTTTSTTTDPGTDTETDETPARRSGGSSSSGTRVTSRTTLPAPIGQVLGASTVNTCPFLVDYMQIGDNNDRLQVTYLQLFLNIFKDSFGGTANPITGVFGAITDANVKAFQEKYRSEVLDPWFERGIVPHDRPTGFVYKTTLWKINSIVCPDFAVYPSFAGEDLTTNVDNDINEPVQD